MQKNRKSVVLASALLVLVGIVVLVPMQLRHSQRKQLLDALEHDDAEKIADLVGKWFSTDYQLADDVDIITKAAWSGSVRSVKVLRSMGASVMKPSDHGRSLLHVAVLGNNPELVDWLVENGLPVNAEDSFGNTPLSLAVSSGSTKSDQIIGILLRSGADPWLARSNASISTIELVARNGNTNILKQFLTQIPPEKHQVAVESLLGDSRLNLSLETRQWLQTIKGE